MKLRQTCRGLKGGVADAFGWWSAWTDAAGALAGVPMVGWMGFQAPVLFS